MIKYSLYLREIIVHLYKSGLRVAAILRVLEEEGFRVSKNGIRYVIKKYERARIIHDLPRSRHSRELSTASTATHAQIDNLLKENNELTTNNILNKLGEQGISTSRSSVGRALKRMGWRGKTTHYCQLIREANKQKRLEFCKLMLSSKETFRVIIFTDEAMVQLKPAHRKSYHKKGEPRRHRPKRKHPIKVFCLGGYQHEVQQMLSYSRE